MQRFDLNRLEPEIDQAARDAMLDVILAFARLDTFISRWMAGAFGTTPDATVILMGNMDTRNKLDKLKALYQHFGRKEGAAMVEALTKAHGNHVPIRNTIAHVACVGRIKDAPDKIAFSAVKRVKDTPGYTFVDVLSLGQMRDASAFAMDACDGLVSVIDQLQRPLQG